MVQLETARLSFRLWKNTDFHHFKENFSDERFAKFLGGTKSDEEAWRLMATYVGHYQLNGFGYLAIEEKDTSNFVGTVGLWKSEPWPELELGYWLVEQGRGKGYATEAGQKCLEYAFNTLAVSSVVSYIDARNDASQKVARRLGGVFEKEVPLLNFGMHEVYRYLRPS